MFVKFLVTPEPLAFYDPRIGKKLLNHKETEQARQQAEQAQFNAIPRLLELGLSMEQVATALSLPMEEVRRNLTKNEQFEDVFPRSLPLMF